MQRWLLLITSVQTCLDSATCRSDWTTNESIVERWYDRRPLVIMWKLALTIGILEPALTQWRFHVRCGRLTSKCTSQVDFLNYMCIQHWSIIIKLRKVKPFFLEQWSDIEPCRERAIGEKGVARRVINGVNKAADDLITRVSTSSCLIYSSWAIWLAYCESNYWLLNIWWL